MPIQGMYTAKEAAEYLSIKVHSVYYYVRKGRLIPDDRVRLYLFSERNLREFKRGLPNEKPLPPAGSYYTLAEATERLNIKREWLYTLARNENWRAGRGMFDKAKVDARAEHVASKGK